MGASGQKQYLASRWMQGELLGGANETRSRYRRNDAILAILEQMWMFEQELGVDKSKGVDSYNYMATYKAITIDSRFYYRAETRNYARRSPNLR